MGMLDQQKQCVDKGTWGAYLHGRCSFCIDAFLATHHHPLSPLAGKENSYHSFL